MVWLREGGAQRGWAVLSVDGGDALVADFLGSDPEGRRLLAGLHRAVDRRSVVRARAYRTPIKTRVLAGGVHSAKQQVVRIDREPGWPLDARISREFLKTLTPALRACDAVVLSDYGSGLITPALAATIRSAMAARSRRRPIPVLVDSRYRLLDYRGLTTCTGTSEWNRSSACASTMARGPERAGRCLLKRTGMAACSSRGPRHGAVRGQATTGAGRFCRGSDG
jgi:bifunctional ADP-heptose synthase (sugar kinase/adenylyltransferase)